MTKVNALAVRASSTPFLRKEKLTNSLILLVQSEIGAGDGNRTHVTSLEGWSSTIELHPRHGGANSIHGRRVVNSMRLTLELHGGTCTLRPHEFAASHRGTGHRPREPFRRPR